MTVYQTPFSYLPLHNGWNAIMGWLKRTVSSRMSSINVVGWKIWCKLSGLEIKILSAALEILQMFLKCNSKYDFIKMIAIQSRLKTNSDRKVLRV